MRAVELIKQLGISDYSFDADKNLTATLSSTDLWDRIKNKLHKLEDFDEIEDESVVEKDYCKSVFESEDLLVELTLSFIDDEHKIMIKENENGDNN